MNVSFKSGTRYAVLGSNGSGKSTLLNVISGCLSPSEGTLHYHKGGELIDSGTMYSLCSIAAPYMELVEEFTLLEFLQFHAQYKEYLPGMDQKSLIEAIALPRALHKPLKFFSSGMKQRVKLALACLMQSELVLLDEPTSNLDQAAINWYHELLEKTIGQRLLIIFSNQPEEYTSCTEHISLSSFKDFGARSATFS